MAVANNAWAVRPKPHNIDRIEEFLEKSMAAIGWPLLGDLTGHNTDQIREIYKKAYPGGGPRSVGQSVGIIGRFVNIKKGDAIAVPYGGEVYFGTASSEYSFHKEFAGDDVGYPHWVGVDYALDGRAISRNQLPAQLYAALKGRQSVFGLPFEAAQAVINNPRGYQPSKNAREYKELKAKYIKKLKEGNIPGVNDDQFESAVQAVLSFYFPYIKRLGKQNAPPGADTDLLAELPGKVVVRVQVKCFREQLGNLGVAAVEQLRKSMNPGDNGIIVTTNEADADAVALAEKSPERPIDIIDVNEFAEIVFENIDKLRDEDLHRLGLTRPLAIR